VIATLLLVVLSAFMLLASVPYQARQPIMLGKI